METKFCIGDYIYVISAENGCAECGRVEEIIIRSEEVVYRLAECSVDMACEKECFADQEEAERALTIKISLRLTKDEIMKSLLPMSDDEVLQAVKCIAYPSDNDDEDYELNICMRNKIKVLRSMIKNIEAIADYPSDGNTMTIGYAQTMRETAHHTLEEVSKEISGFLKKKEKHDDK